tara:strand:+ start:219 stop:533 length:315 start_codon:yes stop_codon:yes gene_type:complete
MDIMETLIEHGLLESLLISTFLCMPLAKETLIAGQVLYEHFIENDEDEYDEDDYDEDVYKLFNENDEDENDEDENDEDKNDEDENDEDNSLHYYYYDVNDDIYD